MTKRNAFESQYYENPSIWEPEGYSGEQSDRAELALNWIPAGVSSILDVGCGNGIFTNKIATSIPVVGMDRSWTALQHVKTSCCQADIVDLPFPDGAFDLVTTMEILEHLPHADFERSLRELARIARRFVLVTVPFKEPLAMKHAICPQCSCRFHRFYHMRCFDALQLGDLFKSLPYDLRLIRLEGVFAEQKIPFISDMVRRYRWRFLLNFPPNSRCPQCGFHNPDVKTPQNSRVKGGFLSEVLKKVEARVPLKKTTYRWWFALYEKPIKGHKDTALDASRI